MPAFPLSRRQALVAAALLGVVLVLAGKLALRSGAPSPAKRLAPPPVARSTVSQPQLVIDVVGAVRRPGLYRLRQGARVADAVARAGGATRKARLDAVNLAAPLADGEQVVVPTSESAGGSGGPAGGAAAPGASNGPVSLSTATLEQLDGLPGIGPVTAQKILDYRAQHGAFRSVDELDAVPGIGPARLDELKGLVVP